MVENIAEPRARPRGRPRSFDPDTALDSAIDLFWRLGYEAADTEALAAAMGLTKPSVYAAFGNKEQLYLKALERYAGKAREDARAVLAAAPDVRAGVSALFAGMAEKVSGGSGCLHCSVAAQSAGTMVPVREILEAGIAARDRALAEYLRAGVARGELPAGFPVEQRAGLMNDLMHGLALRARAGASLAELKASGAAAVGAVLAGA